MGMKKIKLGHGKTLAGIQEEPEVLMRNLFRKESFRIWKTQAEKADCNVMLKEARQWDRFARMTSTTGFSEEKRRSTSSRNINQVFCEFAQS